MTSDQRATFALDLGSATSSVALLGPVNGRVRLLAADAEPAGGDLEVLVARVAARFTAADPALGADLALAPDLGSVERLVARTAPMPRLVVLATSERERAAVERLAATAGWRADGLSLEVSDPVAMARLALERDVAAIVLAAGESPALDPKPAVTSLAVLGAAIAGRDPARPIVLAGLLRGEAGRFAPDAAGAPPPFGPAATAGEPAGAGLRQLLDAIHPGSDDGRHALVRSIVDLAAILDRRVELVEIGLTGGTRVSAGPDGLEAAPAYVDAAALVPPGEPDDGLVDGVLAWSSIALDRHRMRDRLRELRLTPWGEAYGAGAVVRYAAARAALERLVAATPEISGLPAPDLIVVAGGAWAVAPGPAIALAVADVVRRPGASQLAWDHARVLGPLGMIDDQDRRREVLAELAEDLLVPLGTVVTPAGVRAGKTAGKLVIHGESGSSEVDLVPGGLQLVDLPPGQIGIAEFRFRDQVDIGRRARHARIEVGGGLGGLLIDLRDVPLRLPDRLDRRRALLGAWQAALWPGQDG
ncbi:MAG TPA: hypothetical protein VKR24_07570 [Candidatus Limnocylindrales bacterium]|nr:hypothetical protein [Candidatus Limnocylindrales bacterium]